ncbi:UDP-N-acetylmuramate dehydrogenase [Danxiaibacter flavus]|uniref:UDP-N-acetylenolpyruvoylglucosamine reductase n=1 Tax=Danxiaibacter flavus TaxID=3049108 RepID=A0ABV3ZCT0_9BACT|nr:UDP-N-acetylmuramate dehydrogenase [Chitinophagaceae bacterium DXS]
MQILENVSLKQYNTFGIEATARYFSAFQSVSDLEELLSYKEKLSADNSLLPLGGGSNILFTKNFDGLVLKNELKGIEVVREDEMFFYVKAQAGENWHSFVLYCIEHNYAGIENLSLIPGCVGASPMQNIGAYGVEIKDVFESLEAYDLLEKTIVTFNLNDCEFGYRESIFKRKYKNRFIILSVTYKLRKLPVFNTSYGAIEQELDKMQVSALSIQAISQAVINIRTSKLPNPAEIGNAGSFFKNPQIGTDAYIQLKEQYPSIPGYTVDQQHTKIAAGWLIEQCGWKGYREGDAGCHARQALVLVNYGHAKGSEIFSLSEKIISSVRDKFGIELEREVNIL